MADTDITDELDEGVVLYTTAVCSFCRAAKSLLDSRGIPFREVNLGRDAVSRTAVASRTGYLTFPQLVVDGIPVGGYREMLDLDQRGELADIAP